MSDNQIVVITGAQLKEFASDVARQVLDGIGSSASAPAAPEADADRYVYGLRGISGLFNVSLTTAQRYKNTFLQPAVEQRGRVFRVNVGVAQRLFNEHTNQ